MSRRIKQWFAGFITVCMTAAFLPVGTLTAYAANGRIAFTDKTVSVGSEIGINMEITLSGSGTLNKATVMLSYDASMMEFLSGTGASGGAGAIRIAIGGDTADASQLISALKFKALQAGTTKISVSFQEVYDSDNQAVSIDQLGSSSITIQALAGASKEASLSDLKVSPGTLSPEFSGDVFRYGANVGADVTKITVSAPAVDEKASVVISGNEALQPGGNQVVCKVIAEDGTTVKEYYIEVTRAEGVGGTAALVDSLEVKSPPRTVTIIPLDNGVTVPEGFKECEIEIEGQRAQGWVWASDMDTDYQYCIFYGVNEAGEKGFYRYDLVEKTMQRYFRDPIQNTYVTAEEYGELAAKFNSLLSDYQLRLYVIIGLAAVAALLLIIVIVMAVKLKHSREDDYTNYEEKLNERRVPVTRESREERYQRDIDREEMEKVRRGRNTSRSAEPELFDLSFGQASDRKRDVDAGYPVLSSPRQEAPAAAPERRTDTGRDDGFDFDFLDLDE